MAGYASLQIVDLLIADGGEYTAMCAAAILARRGEDPTCEARARRLAADARWRVREGVALGVQVLGSVSPDAIIEITRAWANDEGPLVQRAAVASICEPRLLHSEATAAAALRVCGRVTAHYAELVPQQRRASGARALRQALGYCWSIAVAASPAEGLRAFRALDTTDADIAWVVQQNVGKKRLAALL
ncbi:HEAT repeat domain-containing protein [Microbacterium memoriense]|uniref:HEAT repeat domain-containing protein n=1 Tax=Microbacterium memoriense TaxID=2978350 RepID=A0ABT2PCQ9_9MICO|nr:HEAT repeat domain-containing protein [Microbacterium memoriense]MCT9002359.1 HEAT repeat domain-containing protein [Microbacterium memoriense]